jgi:hypothetical protein
VLVQNVCGGGDGGGENGGMLRAANQRRSTPADSASSRSDLSQDGDLEAMLIKQVYVIRLLGLNFVI